MLSNLSAYRCLKLKSRLEFQWRNSICIFNKLIKQYHLCERHASTDNCVVSCLTQSDDKMIFSPPSALHKRLFFPFVRPFHWSAANSVIPLSVFAMPWVDTHTQTHTHNRLLYRQCVQQLKENGNADLTDFLPELLPVLLVGLHVQLDAEQLSGQSWSRIGRCIFYSFSTACSQVHVLNEAQRKVVCTKTFVHMLAGQSCCFIMN